jgi:hypothetical protein
LFIIPASLGALCTKKISHFLFLSLGRFYQNASAYDLEILIALSHGQRCIRSEQLVAEDLGQEDVDHEMNLGGALLESKGKKGNSRKRAQKKKNGGLTAWRASDHSRDASLI